MLSWSDFIILPFVFWVFRHFYLSPVSIYKEMGYNQVSMLNIYLLPNNILKAINNNIIGLGIETLGSLYFSIYLFFLFCLLTSILIYFFGIKSNYLSNSINFKSNKEWFFIGVYFSIVCSIAYLLVGKIPSFYGNDTRHQILLRISIPFLIIWLISFFKPNFQKYALITLTSLFIVTTTKQNIQFIGSWFKQEALALEFIKTKKIKEGNYFLVLDNTTDLNETERSFSFHSFAGISKKTFQNQSRFFITPNDFKYLNKNINLEFFITGEGYNMKDCKGPISFDKNYLLIQYKGEIPTTKDIVFLLFNKYFSKEKFNQDVNKILDITPLY
jgi:hypothetical protein